MISFWRIFWLEILALVRSRTLALLTVASVVWMFAMPYVVKGDGTAEGAREIGISYSLGGVFALLVIALLASATGAIARERAAKRLQLTMVRPVRYSAIALAKAFAHVSVGAFVLALAAGILAVRTDCGVPCSHVLSPVMPSPREEAKAMYADYMADTNTPAEVRSARKSVVIRLLEQKAIDRYDSIATNATASWRFRLGREVRDGLSVRMRFTNSFEMRQELLGDFRLDGLTGSVSNITQAVLTVPLAGSRTGEVGPDGLTELSFRNGGASALMLRPRRDINLLVAGDSFLSNLGRAYLEMLAILALVVSFGVFLGASLGRPVALFTAIVTLVLSEMAPSVIEQYPDQLETNAVDRIGLVFTRFAAEVTRPVSTLSPLSALSKDECVEPAEVVRVMALDLVAIPILLAFLSALVMPRKQEDA